MISMYPRKKSHDPSYSPWHSQWYYLWIFHFNIFHLIKISPLSVFFHFLSWSREKVSLSSPKKYPDLMVLTTVLLLGSLLLQSHLNSFPRFDVIRQHHLVLLAVVPWEQGSEPKISGERIEKKMDFPMMVDLPSMVPYDPRWIPMISHRSPRHCTIRASPGAKSGGTTSSMRMSRSSCQEGAGSSLMDRRTVGLTSGV